jgi:hypothetical protein
MTEDDWKVITMIMMMMMFTWIKLQAYKLQIEHSPHKRKLRKV